MAYQETTTKSYGSRLGGGLRGIGGGIVAIIIGSSLLWWNEGRAVKTARMLDEAQGAAIHVEDVTRVNPDLEGKLIHACALTATQDSLSDPMFNVGAVAIRLDRRVEFYQWVEESKQTKKDKIGGGEETVTTYTYKKAWTAKPVNSQDFKDTLYRDRNKVLMALEAKEEVAENVAFGAYRLPARMISSISGARPVELSLPQEQLREINKLAIAAAGDTTRVADSLLTYVHVSENQLYIGRSEGAPEIGDVRVTFTVVLPGEASIIAQVQGDTFVNYTAKNGKTLSALSMGAKSMDEMFESQKSASSTWTWILRVLGILIVIGGFKSIFSLLYLLFKVLPFLADIVEAGVGLVAGILGFAWSLIIIALAWIVFRPVLAIIILVIAAVGVFFLIKRGKGMKTVAAVVVGMMICGNANAQFGGLGKKMLDKAKSKVEQKKEEKAAAPKAEPLSAASSSEKKLSATLAEHYDKLEAALTRLEKAIEDDDKIFLFEAPEGNEAKQLINKSQSIAGFDANNPRFIELRDRYIAASRNSKGKLLAGQPATKVKLNDKTASRADRLDALYTLLDFYEKKAGAAQYFREKEHILSVAALCWKTIADAHLMQLNDAKLKGFAQRLNAIGRELNYNEGDNKAKSAKLSSNGKLLLADQVDFVGPLPHLWFQVVDYSDNDYSGDANVDKRLQKQTARPESSPEPASSGAAGGSAGGNDVTKDPKFFTIQPNGETRNKQSKWGKISGNDIYVYSSKAAVIIPTTRFASGTLEVKDLHSNLIVNVLKPYGSGGWEVYDNNCTRKLGYVDGSGNVYKNGSFYCKMERGTKPIWGAVVYLTKVFE